MVTSSSAAASWEPSSASVAVVPILGNRTVCPSSSMSACVATTFPPWLSSSNATTEWPESPVASNSKVTLALPVESLGASFAVAVTALPSAPVTALPVSRSMRVPASSYSFPGTRFSYSTSSVSSTRSAASARCSPPSPVRVVAMRGPWSSSTVPRFTVVASRVTRAVMLTRRSPWFAAHGSSSTRYVS
jgi:hypothetical protein